MVKSVSKKGVALLGGVMILLSSVLPGMVVFAEEVVEVAPVPVVEATSASAMETASAPAVETASAPAVETASAPVVETASAPAVETTSAPVVETASAPAVETASAPVVETASAPAVETTSASLAMRAPLEERIEFFFGSNAGSLYVAGVVVPSPDGKGFVFDKEATKNHSAFGSLPDAIQNNFNNLGEHIIFEIDDKLVLFPVFSSGPKKVYQNTQKKNNLSLAFKKSGTPERSPKDLIYDEGGILAGSWVKVANKAGYRDYNEVKDAEGKIIGYTIKASDYYWFYAPVYPTKTFYTSKGIAFELVVDEDGKVAVEKNKELVEKKYAGNQTLIDTVKAIQAAEILSINGVEVLFAHMSDGQTKAFWAENGVNKLAFNNRDDSQPDNSQVSEPILGSTILYDLESAIAPSWVNPLSAPISLYNEVKNADGKVLGYTFYDAEGGDWFYAPALEVSTSSFYTSNDREIKVVLNDDGTLNFEQTKKVFLCQMAQLTDKGERRNAQALFATLQSGMENRVEIKTVSDELGNLMFVQWDVHTTKVFRSKKDSVFKSAFKNTKAQEGDPLDADLENAIAPSWITADEKKSLTHYYDIGGKAYSLLTESGHWFYAPKKIFKQTPFYTSNNNPLNIVLSDATTVNFPITKKLLGAQIPSIPEALKEGNTSLKTIAQKFYDNATEQDVQIKEVEGVNLLFVNLGTSTKVFAGAPSSIFQNAFKAGEVFDAKKVVYDATKVQAPHWVDLNKDVELYNKIIKDGNLIGYSLKNKDNDWFYAPIKFFEVSFSVDGKPAGATIAVKAGETLSSLSNPEKPGYTFEGRYTEADFKNKFEMGKTPVVSDLVLYAKFKKKSTSSSGGGGGGSSSSSSTAQKKPEPSEKLTEVAFSGEVVTSTCSIEGSQFLSEQNEAYLWACGNDVTTIRTITGARLADPLTRAELAKMMAIYATKILGKSPVSTGTVHYADVDESLGDLANYVQLAYQLRIMGIHSDVQETPLTNFMPHQIVTRAEFAAVFSRVLFGSQFNQEGEEWYVGHLTALKNAKILTNTTPKMQEFRGWVLLMLYRSQLNK